MIQKMSAKSELDNTKITSIINYRNGQLSDATRLYRRQQILKKKLKSIFQTNSSLQRQIKSNQSEIKDERASIQFQLTDLTKQMGTKFGHFVEERLERTQFANNELSHESLQNMMKKYELIEKESLMLKKIFESLQNIDQNYQKHANDMQQLVINSEQVSQQYQSAMENTLQNINEEIKTRIKDNQNLQISTQELVKDIDSYVTGVGELLAEEQGVMGKIQRLKKMASCQQEKVDEIKEWAEIVIDKSNRKAVYRTIRDKEQYLDRLRQKNNNLEIYLRELQNQQKIIEDKNKQNTGRYSKSPSRGTKRIVQSKTPKAAIKYKK